MTSQSVIIGQLNKFINGPVTKVWWSVSKTHIHSHLIKIVKRSNVLIWPLHVLL